MAIANSKLHGLQHRDVRYGIKNGLTIAGFCEKYECTEAEFEKKLRALYRRDADDMFDAIRANEKKANRQGSGRQSKQFSTSINPANLPSNLTLNPSAAALFGVSPIKDPPPARTEIHPPQMVYRSLPIMNLPRPDPPKALLRPYPLRAPYLLYPTAIPQKPVSPSSEPPSSSRATPSCSSNPSTSLSPASIALASPTSGNSKPTWSPSATNSMLRPPSTNPSFPRITASLPR